jgi:myosin-7
VEPHFVISQGDYVWIEPVSGRDFDVAIGAKVVSAEGRKIQVKDDDGRVSTFTLCLLSLNAYLIPL